MPTMTQLKKVLYTAKDSHHRWPGRRRSRSSDGRLDIKLSTPGTPGTAPIPSNCSQRAGRPVSKGRWGFRPAR